jgi:hypothetical protein
MLRKLLLIAVVSGCACLLTPSQAHAQYQNRSVSRPTLSPYSHMYSGGGYGALEDPYMNYMRRFLPQSQPRPTRRDSSLTPTGSAGSAGSATNAYPTSELLRARARSQRQEAGAIAPTGSGSMYMNLGHFYQTPRVARR